MHKDDLIKLYEKSYYHEIEMREKINSRMQLPLAIIVAEISLLGYCIQKSTANVDDGILIIVSSYFFIRAIYNNQYTFLPAPSETEDYRNELIKTYEDYDEKDELVDTYFDAYISSYYIKCATANCNVNDLRSAKLHKAFTCFIIAAISLLITFVLVHFIDKNTRNALNHVVSQCVPGTSSKNVQQPQKNEIAGASNDQETLRKTSTATTATSTEIHQGGTRSASATQGTTSIQESTKTNGEIEDGRQGTTKDSSATATASENTSGKGRRRYPKTESNHGQAKEGIKNKQ